MPVAIGRDSVWRKNGQYIPVSISGHFQVIWKNGMVLTYIFSRFVIWMSALSKMDGENEWWKNKTSQKQWCFFGILPEVHILGDFDGNLFGRSALF